MNKPDSWGWVFAQVNTFFTPGGVEPEAWRAVITRDSIPILPEEQTFVRAERWITYTDDKRETRIIRAGIKC